MPTIIDGKPSKRMERKFIATASFTNKTVVAYGKDPVAVMKEAKKRGYKNPVIVFRPKSTDVFVGGMYYEKGADGVLRLIGD